MKKLWWVPVVGVALIGAYYAGGAAHRGPAPGSESARLSTGTAQADEHAAAPAGAGSGSAPSATASGHSAARPTSAAGPAAATTTAGAAPGANDRPAPPLPTLPPPSSEQWAKGKFSDFTKDELQNMASRCELRWQLPPFASTPALLTPEAAAGMGLSDQEAAAYNRVLTTFNDKYASQLRALYAEATGDSKGAQSMDLRQLTDALRNSATDALGTHRNLAEERAGMRTADQDQSVYERFMRLQLDTGDQFEQALAKDVGATEAKELRDQAGPHFTTTGCQPGNSLYRSERIRP